MSEKTKSMEWTDIDESSDPEDYAPWYEQFMNLDETKRRKIEKDLMAMLSKKKPKAFKFIRDFRCRLVGITPKVAYSLIDSKEGELGVIWVHSFSMPTLLFWCPQGEFGFFINPNLDYDGSVLNKVRGNKKQSIKGFTG